MEKEIMKRVSYRMTLLMVFLFFIPACMSNINAQKQESSSKSGDELLGKWSGYWTNPIAATSGQEYLFEIKKVDQDKKIIEIEYSWKAIRNREPGKAEAKATFIPPDKFEWVGKAGVYFKFQLKAGELWGTRQTLRAGIETTVLKRVKE